MIQVEELEQLREENRRPREANQNWPACVRESRQAISDLHMQVRELEAVISSQQERIKTLEGQLAKDSPNRSLPPSSDRFRRPLKSLRQPSGKKPGGEFGHRGHHLRQAKNPDEILIHPVTCCERCQADLREKPATIAERRQVIDLPVKRLWVKEYRVEEKQCPYCFHLTRATFLPEVKAPARYGLAIQALATYLVEGQSVPYARASQFLQALLGVQLSAGSIASVIKTCHQQLTGMEASLKAALLSVPVLHQDETGMRMNKEGWGVHVCSTDRLTYLAAHPSRGRPALDAMGSAPCFRGTSVHDGFNSCQGYSSPPALCTVHHLRELTFVEEELGQAWAHQMKDLLLEMKACVEQAKASGLGELDRPLFSRLLRRYDEILAEGYQASPPPGPRRKSAQGKRLPGKIKQTPERNLLDRLSQGKWAGLRFLSDFAVPFDNNQAERDLRMVKVQRKISGCFRTPAGLERFCRIRSYLSTLHKQDIDLLAALEQTFLGHPILPAFT
jgi:transposase